METFEMDDSYLYQFRVVVIGDATTGKTALIKSLVNGKFTPYTEPTIGVDLFLSITELENCLKVRLKLWDTAGQEVFRSLTRSYYRNAMGILLVYDVSNRSSFLNIVNWMHEANRYTDNTSLQLVACKSDLKEEFRQVSIKEGKDFAEKHQMKFIETSAKELRNVKEAFHMIAETIMEKVNRGEIKITRYRSEILNGTCPLKYEPIGKTKTNKCSVCKVT